MTLSRFVKLDGSKTYTFPTSPGDQTFQTNFKNLLQQSSKVPGADGGLRSWGVGRAPSPYGNIQVSLYLVSTTRAGMQALRDSLNEIANWGLGILYDKINGVERFAVCAVSSESITEKRSEHSDLFQEVQFTFECPEPFFLGAGNQNLLDGTLTWNGGVDWDDGSFTTITGSGTLTVTPSGNAKTHARLVAEVTGAQAFNQMTVTRLVNNAVMDEVQLNFPMVQNDLIEISPRDQWVLQNGNDMEGSFDVLYADWLRMEPGSNTYAITLDDASAAISAGIFYYDRWT